MITYGSTTLTSYNSIVRTEVYYYKSTSATSLSGGSWATTKPTWENGKYIWQKIRTIYEDGTHTESDPVNITGQQGATGTAAYSYKLNSSDSIIGKTKDGEYTIKKITFSATYKQGTGAVSAYSGRFKIESTTNGSTWKTEYTSSGNEASKEFTIPDDIILIKCSLYQSDGTTVLLDIVTVPIVKDGVDAIGLRDSIPYYLASDKDTGITRLTQGWTRYRPQLTAEKKYLWVYYVSRYSEGTTEPELIEIKDDSVHFVNNGDESPVESCVVDIEPVQDLNGYDNPWPAGGGVNQWDEDWENGYYNRTTGEKAGDSNTTYLRSKNYIPCASNTSYYFKSPSVHASNDTYYAVLFYDADKNYISAINSGIGNTVRTTPQNAQFMTFYIEVGTSGATYNNDIAINYPATVTTYSPYSNICPITGWTGAKVTRTGKNLAEFTHDKGVDTTGHIHDIANRSATVTPIKIDNTRQYKYVNTNSNVAGIYAVWNGDTLVRRVAGVVSGTVMNTSGGDLLYVCGYSSNIDVLPETCGVFFADQYEEFEPYSGQTYDITFPSEAGTVYGGTLDVSKGELVVDKAMVVIDGVNKTVRENGTTSTTSNAWFSGAVGKAYGRNNFISDRFTARIGFAPGGMNGRDKSIGVEFLLPTDIPNNSTALNQWFADNPTQLCYELAEPTTYHLTPQEITMLYKENNIWADTGQTAISYYDNQTSTDPYVDYSLTSAFDAAIDAIEIGGRNLFRGTAMTSAPDGSNNYTDFTQYFRIYNGSISIHTLTEVTSGIYQDTILLNSSGNLGISFARLVSEFDFDPNSQYTISCWAKCTKPNAHLDIGLSYYTTSNTWHWAGGTNPHNFNAVDTWQYFTMTFKPQADTQAINYCFTVVGTSGGTDTFTIRNCKLEKGNKPTAWTPAPEDINSSIATAQTTADTAMDRATAIYGTCSTPTGTAAKAVTCPDFVLFDGARIQVTFTNANTTSAPTLNVNNTGAKPIYINKTVTSSSNRLLWTAGSKMEFVYDGTGWVVQNVPYALYGTCSTGASTAAKDVTCNEAVICKGTTISVNMTNTNTAANATMNVGSTVAKDIYANGAKLTTNSRFNWRANTTQKFVFDGQVWRMDDDSVKALATAYITEINNDGIMVHPENDDTSGWAISDAIQLFKNGISYIKLWIENNIPKIRIGKEDQGHIILDNDSVDIRNDDKVLASFGATSVIGDENDWHQTIAANQITFAKGDDIITYISPDKLYTINAEVADAFYISNYSIRNASDGKLVIGLRR